MLENGILTYATTRQDVSTGLGGVPATPPRAQGGRDPGSTPRKGNFPLTAVPGPPQVLKGKLHGAIDVRQSVMSVNKKAQRVDLDTEDNIYHLKVCGCPAAAGGLGSCVSPPPQPAPVPQIKSPELFASWVSSLCSHHQGERPDPLACPSGGPAGTTPTTAQVGGTLGWWRRAVSLSRALRASLCPQGPWTRILPSGSAPALSALASSRDKVDAWLKDSEGLERCSAGEGGSGGGARGRGAPVPIPDPASVRPAQSCRRARSSCGS